MLSADAVYPLPNWPLMPDQSTPDITIVLPLPPSVNKSWRPGVTKDGVPALFKRAPYKAWLLAASWDVTTQRKRSTIDGTYEIHITIPKTARDPDNASIKQIQDALQKGGALANDKHLMRLVLQVDTARAEPTALVQLWRLE